LRGLSNALLAFFSEAQIYGKKSCKNASDTLLLVITKGKKCAGDGTPLIVD